MNTAQHLTAAWLGVDPDWFDRETALVAVDQNRAMCDRYKAPHAPRATFPRPKRRRNATPRLFKGHRI